MVMAQWLTGITSATYDDMVKFLRRNARVPIDYPQAVEDMPVFRTVCREMGWPTQAWFKIAPVCILHWRVMSSVLHFLTPTHQDMMFTERYNQREDNLSLEESIIPDAPVTGQLCAAVATATIQEEAQEAEKIPQEKALEVAISSKAEILEVEVSSKEQHPQEKKVKQNPEDRCIVFLVWENIKRMVPVHSLDNLRTLAEERFPGNGAATLFFKDTLLDPLITLQDIVEIEPPRPTIEVRFLDSTKL
ncbi:unnamed protein product [Mytilus edulis]|uniref:Uncharacterized protein n=1 Tax=Mytilus edulis TaxID=6550 RepID=A0A8S3R143_MYTED|nr:unnamed protein product [Mytilus edulis]